MCLTKIDYHETSIATKTPNKIQYGWKIFERIDKNTVQVPYRMHQYKIGRHIKDTHIGQIAADMGGLYERGFHLFATRQAARDFMNYKRSSRGTLKDCHIRKVRYSQVTAIGEDCGYKCVVAKKIFIEKD